MQTLTFRCTHCQKRMAVQAELAGRSVRCPHCKQVLTAPLSSGDAPPQPVIPPPVGSQAETTELSPMRPESSWQPPPGHESIAPNSDVDLLSAKKKGDPFGLFGGDSDDGTGSGPRRMEGSESIFEEPGLGDDNVFMAADPPPRFELDPPTETSPPDRFGDPFPPVAPLPGPPLPPAPPPLGTRGSQGVMHIPLHGFGSSPIGSGYTPPHAIPGPVAPIGQPGPHGHGMGHLPPAGFSPIPQPISSGLQTFAPIPPQPVVPGNPWAEMTGEMPGLPDPPPAPIAKPATAPVPALRTRATPAETPALDGPPPRKRGVLLPILLIYSIIVTGIAIWSLLRGPEAGPLSTIPDFYGEYEKSDRKSGKATYLPKPDEPIPPRLRVGLKKTLTVGQLQIEPLAVEQQKLVKVSVPISGPPKEETLSNSLVLTLKLKNLSDSVTFHPVDPAFNRRWDGNEPAVAGVYLPLKKQPFLGGPIPWPFPGTMKRIYIKGQENDDQPLKPGEERVYLIPLVDSLTISQQIRSARGQTLLWKVLLRRGTVRYWFSDVSVCTLIGVEFTPAEVKWLPSETPGKDT